MINNYVYVKELAEDLLNIALKYDELDKFILVDYPGYEVFVNDGMGNKVDSIDAKMQAIYKKYSTDNTVKEKLLAALSSRITRTKNERILFNLIEVIKYQLREEEINNAPFNLDCKALLELARANISKNIDFYSCSSIEKLKIYSQYLETNYGFKLM